MLRLKMQMEAGEAAAALARARQELLKDESPRSYARL